MSKIEELIEKLCPNGVEYKLFNDIAIYIRGVSYNKTKEINNGGAGYKLLRANNITLETNTLNYEDVKIIDYSVNVKENQYLKKNDILICAGSGSKEHIGKVAYLFEDIDYTFGGFMGVIRIKNNTINPRYLFHIMTSPIFKSHLEKVSNTSTINNINNDTWVNFKIAVPPLEVQHEIVHVLDDFTLLSAELSAELKAREKQYEYYRNEIIKKCDGREGKLIELLSQPITDGPHTTPKLYPTGIPFVSATAVYNGKVHLEDAKGYISKEFDEECSKKYKPKRNDVYMVKSGSTTGKVAYVDFDGDFNIWSPLAAMRTENVITSRYLYHLLQTTDVQNQVQSRMSHGSQPNLSMRVLEQFDVKIPSLTEQERIVNILDKLDLICNDMFKGLPAEISSRKKQYEYYRDKLLTFKELVNEG